MPIRLAPSLLSADQTDLRGAIDACAAAGIDLLHLDVMDGHYVPNLTFGPKVAADIVKYIRAREFPMELDVHLMVTDPDRFVEAFATAGADWLTVHVEAPRHPHRTLTLIRELGCRPGLSLNPGTPLALLEELVPAVDLVLLMSVNPGFSGQHYIPESLAKVRRCRAMLLERESTALIEVDGGIGPRNIAEVTAAGASLVVVGNAAFGQPGGPSVADNIGALRLALASAP